MPKVTTRGPKPTAKSSTKNPKGESLRDTPIPPGDEVGAAEMAARVAANLHEQRRRRDMSLDQLAQRTGVSRAGLSQIETRKTNPSIGVLWKIASGLGIPFSELIGDSQHAVSVLLRSEAQVLRSTDRKFESRPLMPAGGANQIEVYELRLAAHSQHRSEAHGTGTRELIIVLNGSLRMVIGGHGEDLAAGDSMLFNANATHVYENPGGAEARYHNVIIYPLR